MRQATWAVGLGALLMLAPPVVAQHPTPADNSQLDAPPNEFPTNLVKILRTSNKAQTNRYVPRVYDFKNVNPYAVIRFVKRVMQIEESAWFSFATPEMDSGKLLVTVPEYQLPYLDDMMAELDRTDLTTSSGTKRAIIPLKHRDGLDPGVFNGLAAWGTPTVKIQTDVGINAMFLEDAPSAIEQMVRVLETEIDTPKEQLEAVIKVYEVDISDDGRLGLDYISWKNGPGRNAFAFGAYAQRERISSFDGPSSLNYNSGNGTAGLPGRKYNSSGANYAYFFDLPSAFFDFLVAKGKARIMTRSKVTALNRTTASLEIGEEIMYYAVQTQNDLRAGSRLRPLDPFGDLEPSINPDNPINEELNAAVVDYPDNRTVTPLLTQRSLASVNTGFTFRMTPEIHYQDSQVALFMALVNITGWAADGTPVLANRSVDTVINIPRDGREITIGGMVSQRRIDGAQKIPLLGDIPVLGYLFGGESRMDQKNMVVVTLSTRVLGAESTWTPDDTELENMARGETEFRTPENNPGLSPGVNDVREN